MKYVFIFALISSTLCAQSDFFQKPSPFAKHDMHAKGRITGLTSQVLKGGGAVIGTVVRKGSYPNWTNDLELWKVQTNGSVQPWTSLQVDKDARLVDLIPLGEGFGIFFIKSRSCELWSFSNANLANEKKVEKISIEAHLAGSEPGYLEMMHMDQSMDQTLLSIPTMNGISLWSVVDGHIQAEHKRTLGRVHNYLKSSSLQLPFEFPFWFRSTVWYPKLYTDVALSKEKQAHLEIWQDEVETYSTDDLNSLGKTYLQKLSDAERDDGLGYVTIFPSDMNGDGMADLVVNKFKGAATQMVAETSVHLGNGKGQFSVSGESLKAQGNRTAGALPYDVNKDGYNDLVSASSQLNAWAIVKALTRRTVEVSFNLYFSVKGKIDLSRPSATRDIEFGFDLSDLSLRGFFPTLDGDFNGDGLSDVLYARDDKEITILFQNLSSNKPYSDMPSVQYPVAVKRNILIEDLNGDKKADIIMFDKRSKHNESFTVLLTK